MHSFKYKYCAFEIEKRNQVSNLLYTNETGFLERQK